MPRTAISLPAPGIVAVKSPRLVLQTGFSTVSPIMGDNMSGAVSLMLSLAPGSSVISGAPRLAGHRTPFIATGTGLLASARLPLVPDASLERVPDCATLASVAVDSVRAQ
ncbi:MAG TPA: hypothetical protein VJT33_03935 [bacterium]|nr:hypothetical protein [bacterium]